MAISGTIEEQHERIHLLVDRLDLISRSSPDRIPENRWRAVIEFETENLSEHLAEHFGFEERGGYMAEIVKNRPDLHTRGERLLEQHGTIRASFEDLLSLIRGHAAREAIEVKLDLALELMRVHERTEVRFMQEGVVRDIGGRA